MRIIVDNRIRIRAKDCTGEIRLALTRLFEHKNPVYAFKRSQGYPVGGEKETEVTWALEGVESDAYVRSDWLTFPRGGMNRVRGALDKLGVEREISDEREEGEQLAKGTIPPHQLKLYPYQEMVVQAAIAKQNCLIKAPTGSGKSTMALAMASRLNVPTVIIVWSGSLFEQWFVRIQKELRLGPDEIGVIRGDGYSLRPITIAMQQTLHARGVDEGMNSYFGMVMLDEVQRCPALTVFSAIDPFSAKYRIGISADHTRSDKKEFLTYDLFGNVAVDIPKEQLIASGHIVDVDIHIVNTHFTANWYRHNQNFVKLVSQMVFSESRNEVILDTVMKEVQAGEQVMVFAHRRGHCQTIAKRLAAKGVKTGLLLGGEESEEEFRRTRAGLERGTIQVGVGTVQAIGQGLDIPAIGVGVVATPVAANRQLFGQVRGRLCRTAKGKTGAKLYYLNDVNVYGVRHIENLTKWNSRVFMRVGEIWTDARAYLKRSAA